MKLRAPSIPLITVDPYFSIWSPHEVLNFRPTVHWTGKENPIHAVVEVDGTEYSFLGYERNAYKCKQTHMDIDAMTTAYTMTAGGIEIYVSLTSPLLLDRLDILTRPVSYMSVSYSAKDGRSHSVKVRIIAAEELCLNSRKQSPVVTEEVCFDGIKGIKIGNSDQKPLNRSGDDLRIDWGYFYLCAKGDDIRCGTVDLARRGMKIFTEFPIAENESRLVLFAYDDLGKSINYFGKELPSYWNRNGKTITEAIAEAAADYSEVKALADDFSDKLIADAYMAGGEKYADLLSLGYRQTIAAHKVAVDDNGDILFISKECFSNGCAATVDVSYPSIPLFLCYNTELIKGMLRPIYKFAGLDAWRYDFAPHDAGQYPLVTGQVYGLNKETGELAETMQMPVEECGNMIIMEANVAIIDGNADFACEHIDTLKAWCEYLIKYGDDPEHQLCTDDFAGHLAHNCNLSLKAIMGIMGMSVLTKMLGDKELSEKYEKIAREKAISWVKRAANNDGSYKLAFDRDGSFSMKYNMVWDKLWGTALFDERVYDEEISTNFTRFNKYGMPLDSRSEYTKSDWLVWTATLAKKQSDFKKFISPLWDFYNESPSRVPMSDWYDTVSGFHVGFIHRTVIGGLFIKLLDETKKLRLG